MPQSKEYEVMDMNGTDPAFPTNEKGAEGEHYCSYLGMSLRDYLAAHAPEQPKEWHGGEQTKDAVVAWRWSYADAMLKARNS